jgi:TRAP-type C4-dicarboxylate transport system permease small subunit
MKRDVALIALLFLLLLLALVLSMMNQPSITGNSATSTDWLPPDILPGFQTQTPTQGWWVEMPSPVPLPTLIPDPPK